ncbi:MAG: chaperone NapD [Burkholderiales bacterium]|nr:chaperone NapD [Burkholderiales bacterium]
MNYSGLLVTIKPGHLEETIGLLNNMANVEVHQVQKEASRCIVVAEAEDIQKETEIFKAISDTPNVVDVSLIVHHFEDSAELKPIKNLEKLTPNF